LISQTITTSVGEEFSVRLESTPTTGYVWVVDSLPNGLDLLGNEHEPPGGGPMPGGTQDQVFLFRALAAGEYQIDFSLKRQWESQAIQTHSVRVKVD
jgi:predicted secreted protein